MRQLKFLDAMSPVDGLSVTARIERYDRKNEHRWRDIPVLRLHSGTRHPYLCEKP